MVYTVSLKRAFLRVAYAGASPLSLLAALVAKLTTAVALVASGQIIRQTSSADVSVEFSDPDKSGVNPTDMVEMWESLLSDYDTAEANLIASGIPTPTDAQIYAEMLANGLIATSSYGGDFTQLRREPNTIRGMT